MRKFVMLFILLVAFSGLSLAQWGAPPAAPDLYAPAPDAVLNDPSELEDFRWSFVTEATDFKLIVKDVKSGAKVLKKKVAKVDICAPTCVYAPSESELAFLQTKGEYSWKVKAINDEGKTTSASATFTTEFPGKVTLNSPDNDYIVGAPENIVGFTWTENPFATEYKIIVKNSTTGEKVVNAKINASDSAYCLFTCAYYLTEEQQALFESDTIYHWKVKAMNALGKSTSEKRSILTMFNG